MAVVTTNLGVITAYGDAVAAGYTGTKAQWQALMANYATVGQQAAQDAQTASTAAQTATTAAQTATTKASEASASATAAAASAASIGTPDTTLTQSGKAADAKATGDEISALKEDLTDLGQDNIAYMSLVNDHKILTNTLVLSDNRLTSCTDYIRVPEDAYKVEVATKISTNVYILPQCFFFDENKSYISRNSNQTADYATFEIPDGTKYIRVNQPSSNDGSPRLIRFIKRNIREIEENAQKGVALENDNSLLRHRASLAATDNMNNLAHAGAYFFTTDNKPANSPTNLLSRPVVIKSATASNHSGEAQFIIQDGVFYFRSKEVEAYDWNDWKSYGLGAPVYQQETPPYNAVTYHAKWDALIQDRVLRRVNLGYVDDDSSYPIYAYEFCPQRDMVVASGGTSTAMAFDWSNALYQRPKILIIGGVHGNEKCTPMDIYAIAKMLLKRDNNDVACKFDWYFIPLVNPWGYSHARLDSNGDIIYDNSGTAAQIVECTESINAGIRNNAHGQNINRDWSDVVYTADGVQYGFQTPELQLIKNYALGIAPDIFIDAHQNHANRSTSNTNPVCCHAGAPINSADTSNDYAELMRKIYRRIDIANADTDKTMLRYANHPTHKYQACRIWDTLPASTSEHYFAGVTALNGSTVIGNTQHGSIATPYSICTETSEICATYSKTTDWYNPVACTFSCTYLWNIIKQIASLF